ncbi:MAG: Gfo/Idh/MocA family oxidoreductase [Gemmatimonadota bacterium]|nr:Gfo/Idh/MocA family oxidoreductase [Gemmatimonadota bacterium]
MIEKPKKVRLGIIGCGIIANERHVPALLRLKDRFTVSALCNRTRPKAEAMAEKLGLDSENIWLDWRRMLDEAPVDAVLICLPIEMNCEVGSAAASAGKHVLCEKPLGRNPEELDAIADLGAQHGVTYMCAENYHYEPTFAKAAHLVQKDAIGQVTVISWNLLRFMELDNKYNKTAWRVDHHYPGGYLLDGGVHYIHVIRMMAGRICSVAASTRSIEPGLGKIDTAFALLTHENGVLSSLNMSWHTRDPENHPLCIFGTQGSIMVDDRSLVLIDEQGNKSDVPYLGEDSFYLELIDFHRAVALGEEPLISIESAAHDVEVILAMLESAEKGRPVNL